MDKVAIIRKKIQNAVPEGLIVPRHTAYAHFYEHTPTRQKFPSVTGITGIMSSPHLKQWAVNEGIRYIERVWDTITPENREEHFKVAQLAHTDTLREAGDIGTLTHDSLEAYINEWIDKGNRPDDIKKFIKLDDSRLYATARSATLFFNDFYLIPIVSEMKVVSLKHGYGGTLDCLAYVGKVINEGNGGRTGFEKCNHHWGVSGRLNAECMHCGRKLKLTLTLLDWKSSNSLEHDEYAEQLSAYSQALYELTGVRPRDHWIVRLDKYKARYEVVRVTDRVKAFKAFIHTKKKFDWMTDGVSKLYPVVEKEVISIV